MKKSLFSLACAAALLAGCEWSSSGHEDSWSDSYNTMNFAGTYRTAATATAEDSGSGTVETPVNNQYQGDVTSSDGKSCAGSLKMSPVLLERGVTITLDLGSEGTYVMAGSGSAGSVAELTGSKITGTATESGGWSAVLSSTIAGGFKAKVYATYAYSGSSGSTTKSEAPTAITVVQSGQNLTMRMNNGVVLTGKFTHVNVVQAADEGGQGGMYNAQFEVSGGTYRYVGTLTHVSPTQRQINGTLTHGNSAWDVSGTSGSGSSSN